MLLAWQKMAWITPTRPETRPEIPVEPQYSTHRCKNIRTTKSNHPAEFLQIASLRIQVLRSQSAGADEISVIPKGKLLIRNICMTYENICPVLR